MRTITASGQHLYSCDVCHEPITGSIWCHEDKLDRCFECSVRLSDGLFGCWQQDLALKPDSLAIALCLYVAICIDHVRAGTRPVWDGAPAFYDGVAS